MIIKNAELETVCGITSILPVNDLPEVAFAENHLPERHHSQGKHRL